MKKSEKVPTLVIAKSTVLIEPASLQDLIKNWFVPLLAKQIAGNGQ